MIQEQKNYVIVTFIFLLLIAGAIILSDPLLHFWKDDYTRHIERCYQDLPMYNISTYKNVAWCYNEGWKDYCKVISPKDCD